MDQVFILALAVSVVFLICKFIEMKFVDKETKPIKFLIRDAVLVYMSVVAGYYVIDQIQSPQTTSNPIKVFTDPPNF